MSEEDSNTNRDAETDDAGSEPEGSPSKRPSPPQGLLVAVLLLAVLGMAYWFATASDQGDSEESAAHPERVSIASSASVESVPPSSSLKQGQDHTQIRTLVRDGADDGSNGAVEYAPLTLMGDEDGMESYAPEAGKDSLLLSLGDLQDRDDGEWSKDGGEENASGSSVDRDDRSSPPSPDHGSPQPHVDSVVDAHSRQPTYSPATGESTPPSLLAKEEPVVQPGETPFTYEESFPTLGVDEGSGHISTTPSLPPETPQKETPVAPNDGLVHLAIIIDDLGHNAALSKAMANLPADITLAVLPDGPYSRQVVDIAKRMDKEIILHQPMEPTGPFRHRMGPAALVTSMNEQRIQSVLRANLDLFPEVVGINNHMGSMFTASRPGMQAVMSVLAQRRLYFIDSRTSKETVAESQAIANRIPTARRDVFLDNVRDVGKITTKLNELITRARQQSGAIGIGHPYPETLAALRNWLRVNRKRVAVERASRFLTPISARAQYQ
ncbi:MAG: divergent polysaccharide deacetylase family protein [Magnetococcales bacterium]|nr:divergent polysaccharide deacetylase family protein [Magnetococcales bacterium]